MKKIAILSVFAAMLILSACGNNSSANSGADNGSQAAANAGAAQSDNAGAAANDAAAPSADAAASLDTGAAGAYPDSGSAGASGSTAEAGAAAASAAPAASASAAPAKANTSATKKADSSGSKASAGDMPGMDMPNNNPSAKPSQPAASASTGTNGGKSSSTGDGATGTAKTDKAASTDHVIDISNFSFSMDTLEIHKGDTVTFINHDSAEHSATADDNSFDTGLLAKDESKTITFDQAGEISYHCSVHPGMQAKIDVKA